MTPLKLLKRLAYPETINGNHIEAILPDVSIGEMCEIYPDISAHDPVARAQVVGFRGESVQLSLVGKTEGLSKKMIIRPTGKRYTFAIDDSCLGSVVDATGRVTERLSPACEPTHFAQSRLIDTPPPDYLVRDVIKQPLVTGIRVIDGVLTCGIGQRVGIFASAGCGKTILMHMLIAHAQADVFVIGLIGERGREVTECADYLKKSEKAGRCVLIYATSDFSSTDRVNAAQLATTIAEYFRDQGKNVILFLDSMTRYARALRDMKLALGEPPARRGYPASVFDSLPRLLERPGLTATGSITAFYTVLLESENENDPLGDEIRSILDGHIYLSRALAGQGHYPAVDVLNSVSRVFGQVTEADHKGSASSVREILQILKDLQVFIDLGEYKPGLNVKNDWAMNARDALYTWLKQTPEEHSDYSETLERMAQIVN